MSRNSKIITEASGNERESFLTQEDLEDSINRLSQLKPVMQARFIRSNLPNKQQAVEELGKHFDTAIEAMTMLLKISLS